LRTTHGVDLTKSYFKFLTAVLTASSSKGMISARKITGTPLE